MRNCNFAYTYPTKKNYGNKNDRKDKKIEKSVTNYNASLRSASILVDRFQGLQIWVEWSGRRLPGAKRNPSLTERRARGPRQGCACRGFAESRRNARQQVVWRSINAYSSKDEKVFFYL